MIAWRPIGARVAPGSALSCLMTGRRNVEAACEKSVSESGGRLGGGGLLTAKLALLVDRNDYTGGRPTPASELAPLSQLSSRIASASSARARPAPRLYGGQMDALTWFSDHSQCARQLRDRTFDEHGGEICSDLEQPVARRDRRCGGRTASFRTSAAHVSPRYDFPSSQSIPQSTSWCLKQPPQGVRPMGSRRRRPATAMRVPPPRRSRPAVRRKDALPRRRSARARLFRVRRACCGRGGRRPMVLDASVRRRTAASKGRLRPIFPAPRGKRRGDVYSSSSG